MRNSTKTFLLTWRPIFEKESTFTIGDVAVSASDPDIVYVAALGHFWSRNEERGVFRTTDGGQAGSMSSSSPTMPGLWRWPWIPPIPQSCMLRLGRQ